MPRPLPRARPRAFLLWELTRAEARLRDQGTVLGFLWTLLHPLLLFLVLYGLFIKWVGSSVEGYAGFLLVGIVLWGFFQKGTVYAMTSLRRHRGALLNYRFPRETVVLAAVGAVLWSTVLEAAVLLPVLAAMGHPPAWTWLLAPAVLGLLAAVVCGLSLVLALLSAEFQDMDRIWEVLTSALFYATPIFYPLSSLGAASRRWLALSPLTQALEGARACLLEGRVPDAGLWAGLATAGALTAAAGFWAMRRFEARIADRLVS